MKASELMVGDWVHIKAYNRNEKVTAIWANGVICNFRKDFDEIEPIPLTAEILEKNGFVYCDYPFIMGWQQFGLTLYKSGRGYAITCGTNVSLRINSVHELQHALKLCGIDKEIEL